MKDLHFAPANAELGRPLRHVDITLRTKETGNRIMSLEGAAISDGRTGWLALACIDLFLKGKHDIEIFLFGAGKVAEAVILALDSGTGERIKRVAVLSHHGKSNYKLVEKHGSRVKFDLVAVIDRNLLRTAKLVITATSANKPVFETQELAPNAVTLALGVDELPADYIPFVMNEDGVLVVYDMELMESFGADSIARYYASNDLKLTEDGRDDGIRNYAEVLNDPALMEKIERLDGPASFSAAGLASLDLAVAAYVYETLMTKLSDA